MKIGSLTQLFSPDGRIGRKQFALLFPILTMSTIFCTWDIYHFYPTSRSFLLIPFIAITMYVATNVVTQRLHDLGKGGWVQLFFLIPIWNLFLLIALFIEKGDRGPNAYGQDPAPVKDYTEDIKESIIQHVVKGKSSLTESDRATTPETPPQFTREQEKELGRSQYPF